MFGSVYGYNISVSMKRVLVFSAPFGGHLNVLKTFISQYRGRFNFKLLVTGWRNIPAAVADAGCATDVLGVSDLMETDPIVWTRGRVRELLPDCLKIAQEFKPDLIIYDFFSLEGREVGMQLGIPYWCSIPAMVGPFTDEGRRYLKDRGIEDLEAEMISDGLHYPGQLNLVWSYAALTPKNFHEGRKGDYAFIGNPNERLIREGRARTGNPRIYISLGTVVMDNLWNRRADVRERLRGFVRELAASWGGKPYEVVFVTQGKEVLASYPGNWCVIDRADQMRELAEADVFVSHGGNNGFVESVLNKVPLVVIPFFGDQPLVARQAEALGIGIRLVGDIDIDTHADKSFVGPELAHEVDAAVARILGDDGYRQRLAALSLEHADVGDLIDKALS
jgi:hypothetical protein